MKLLLCTKCFDVIKIMEKSRWCSCGACSAVLTDCLNARVYGGEPAVVLGFGNTSLAEAIVSQRSKGDLRDASANGRRFDAFIIPGSASTVLRVSAIKKDKLQTEGSLMTDDYSPPEPPDPNLISKTLRRYLDIRKDPVLNDAVEALCEIAMTLDEAECISFADRTVAQLDSTANEILNGRPAP
jgi:hypothetical protein